MFASRTGCCGVFQFGDGQGFTGHLSDLLEVPRVVVRIQEPQIDFRQRAIVPLAACHLQVGSRASRASASSYLPWVTATAASTAKWRSEGRIVSVAQRLPGLQVALQDRSSLGQHVLLGVGSSHHLRRRQGAAVGGSEGLGSPGVKSLQGGADPGQASRVIEGTDSVKEPVDGLGSVVFS